ncbi:MAG: protein kinase, partial [Candidatus Cloacimonetes bacterium]|nr:protein kinase [Candidatus Cloacimonadota bacterium]
MPFCVNCSKEINSEWKICPICGKPNPLSQSNTESTPSDSGTTIIDGGKGNYGLELSNLPKGFEIEGRYRIEAKLGRGGFGTVYKVWDNNVESWKALKVIDNIFYDDEKMLSKLRKETLLLMKMNTEYIVRIWGIHLSKDIKYIDMEYLEGRTLSDVMMLYPNHKIPERMVCELTIQICKGMIEIHKNNIVHKSLNLQNVLLTQECNIKI